MRQLGWIVFMFVLIILPGTIPGTLQATSRTPRTPATPPVPQVALPASSGSSSNAAPVSLNLPALKAVLLVGPIDGDDGTWTTQEKENMDLAAAELTANGVTVHKFYTPNNNWDEIKAAAAGAHFLLYRGHGVYWGEMPTPPVGGFSLKDRFISSDTIRSDLKLAPNAIIMLYGCFTAGTASNDSGSISSTEAQRRVAQYSDPFFDIGAGGYYANWYGNAFQMFIRTLFQGKTLQQAYETFSDFDAASVERYTHPDHPNQSLWLDKDVWDGITQYNNAFVGLPGRTLEDLFHPTTMELSANAITHVAKPGSSSRSFALNITSSSGDAFTWHAAATTADVTWLTVQPLHGSSSEALTLVINPAGLDNGTYRAGVRILADDTTIQAGDQTVTVTLQVAEQLSTIALPLLQR